MFFELKTQEFFGSTRQWDYIVETVLHDLPRNPYLKDREVPGLPGFYGVQFQDDLMLFLTYYVFNDATKCEIRLLDLVPMVHRV